MPLRLVLSRKQIKPIAKKPTRKNSTIAKLKRKIFPKSHIIIVTKKIIILAIISN